MKKTAEVMNEPTTYHCHACGVVFFTDEISAEAWFLALQETAYLESLLRTKLDVFLPRCPRCIKNRLVAGPL